MDLLKIAARVALYDELADEIDPNYQRVLAILNTNVKSTLKDLISAVKAQDEILTLDVMNRLMQNLEEIYKHMGMRQYKQKLDALTERTFEP